MKYISKLHIILKEKQCLHADAFAEFGDVITRLLGKHLSGLFGPLMQKMYLEKGNFCTGKIMFAYRLFAKMRAAIARCLSRQLARPFGTLLHLMYLTNPDNC